MKSNSLGASFTTSAAVIAVGGRSAERRAAPIMTRAFMENDNFTHSTVERKVCNQLCANEHVADLSPACCSSLRSADFSPQDRPHSQRWAVLGRSEQRR